MYSSLVQLRVNSINVFCFSKHNFSLNTQSMIDSYFNNLMFTSHKQRTIYNIRTLPTFKPLKHTNLINDRTLDVICVNICPPDKIDTLNSENNSFQDYHNSRLILLFSFSINLNCKLKIENTKNSHIQYSFTCVIWHMCSR